MSFGVPQFVGGAPREMTVELLFDVTLSKPAKASVRPITDALFAMMEVPNGGSGAGSAPPTVTFRWGAFESFKAVPTSVDVRFVLFRARRRAGPRVDAACSCCRSLPTRARAAGRPPAQNPTTRAAEAGSSCVVCEGDSLPSLAYDAYGDPTAWRDDRPRQRHRRPAAAASRPPPRDPGGRPMTPVGAATDLAAGCKVTLGGGPLDPTLAARIIEVRVETTVGLPDVCTIRLAEDPPTQRRAEGHRRRAVQARRAADRQDREGDRRPARPTSSTARSRRSRPSSGRRSRASPCWS